MFLLDEHGSGSVNWKKNLIVLWTGVFLACASFTACIPFLPVYLQKELHVPPDQLNLWAGLVYAVTFLGATFMAPYWGAWADRVGQRKMAIRAGFGLAVTYMLGAIVQTAPQMLAVRILTGLISGFVPASMSLVSSTLPGEKLGWGMGWMQAALASGNILGPLLGGYLSVWFGMRTSFFVGSGCLFLVTMMVIFFVRDIPISKETSHQDMHVVRDLRLALQNRGLLYVMFMFFLVQTCIMTIDYALCGKADGRRGRRFCHHERLDIFPGRYCRNNCRSLLGKARAAQGLCKNSVSCPVLCRQCESLPGFCR